jgi:hypothetical protein
MAVAVALAAASVLAVAPQTATADATPAVTSVAVTPSFTTVYPHVDGYRDSVTIDVDPTTTDGAAAASTGVVTITKGTKVAKSWKLTGGADASLVWNGRLASKIVTGTYAVTATFTNPDASTAVGTSSIVVSSKGLVAHHWTKKAEAGKVTDCYSEGFCTNVILFPKPIGGKLGKAYQGAEYKGVESVSTGNDTQSHLTLPTTIVNAVKAKMSVSASVSIGGTKGHRFYIAPCAGGSDDGCDNWGAYQSRASSGSISTSSIVLEQGQPDAAWLAAEKTVGSHATVGYYTVHVTYYTLG